MALSTASITRRFNIHGLVVALSLTGGVLALLPIVAGVVSGLTGSGVARTAFASAPSGDYAVFSQAGESSDTILVASADASAEPLAVGAIPHLPGFPAAGAVSPDGRRVAFVAVDAGTAADPGASLLTLDLESGSVVRLATAIDHLQQPLWAPDGGQIILTRGGDAAPGPVAMLSVDADGSGEAEIGRFTNVLGLYPVGFDGDGRLIAVVLDGRGSTLVRDGRELHTFSPNITRDWVLDPDGVELAFIDTVLAGGARYEPKVVDVEPGVGVVAAQTLAGGPEALGASWNPHTGEPVFGSEPLDAGVDTPGVSAQRLVDGFDIPLGFASTGDAHAVQHWTGDSFDNPGVASFELVTDEARFTLPGATGFFGWAAR